MNCIQKVSSLAAATTIAFASVGTASAANISVNASIGPLSNADGSERIPDGTFVFVHDADQDGFGDIGTSNTYETDDPGDVVLDVVDIGTFFGEAGFFSDTFGPFNDLPVGSFIRGVFYDNDFATSQDAPGVGTDFGIVPVDLEVPGNASGLPFEWTTTEVFGGENAPSTLYTNDGTVVPEPGSLALLGLGGLLMARRRR